MSRKFFISSDPSVLSVCFVRPPTVTSVGAVGQDAVPPLGLAYLAGSLEAEGIKTSAVDAVGEAVHQYTVLPEYKNALLHGLRTEQIVERIPKNSQIIAVSCMFSVEWPFVQPVIEAIRAAFPDAFLIAGGEHINACPEFVLDHCPALDVCILGEGEETIVDLVKAYRDGRPFTEIAGLCIRHEGTNLRTAKRMRIKDIDSIPEPHWDIFPLEEYIKNALTHGANLGRCIPILASRGCPYDCTFCSSPQMWTRKWVARKPELVIAEMKKYMQRYNVTNFDFYDLTAIVRKEWILDFCRKLEEENLHITWQLPSGTRSEAIDEEVCPLLYRSGCRVMNYAPESGSQAELKRIKKRVELGKMLVSMRSARKAGIKIKCNFIFGLPGSTWVDVRATFIFMARLAWAGLDDLAAFSYSPYPGSELFNQLVKEGRITMNQQYFKDLLAYTDPGNSVSYNDNFSPKMLSVINMISMLWFYSLSWLFRPKRFFALIYAFIVKDTSSKLTMALSNVQRKSKAANLAGQQGAGKQTVVIEPMFKPTETSALK